jgi:membrane protease YdiL (CAAX protease family)
MESVLAIWRRIPVIIRAVLVALVVASTGSFPWAWLAQANLHHLRGAPWGPVVMAVYLWLYWQYFTGRGWPASTSALRRERSRPRALSGSVWSIAIVAGILGLAASIVLMRLIGRLVALPVERAGDISGIPPVTLLAMLVMGSLVAGVVEEVSFRGYMQRPIERHVGPTVAIVVVGVVFGLAHGTHTEWTLVLMPYYIAVAATYGALAWLTDSILPSLALHAGGDFLGGLQVLTAGNSVVGSNTAGAGAVPAGVNMRFWINLVVLAAVVTAAIWAYRQLAAVVHEMASQTEAGSTSFT